MVTRYTVNCETVELHPWPEGEAVLYRDYAALCQLALKAAEVIETAAGFYPYDTNEEFEKLNTLATQLKEAAKNG